jgi:hypothetical protein
MIKPTSRAVLAVAIGAIATLSIAVAFVAVRSAQAQSKEKEAAALKASAATTPEATGGAGALIFIDPATGQARQPDAEEIGTLLKLVPEPKKKMGKGMATFPSAGGGVGMVVDPSMDCSMVATKEPTGKMKMDCVVGEQAAAAIVNGQEAVSGKESHDEK